MANKPLPSQEVLRQLLDYDPETGALKWRERGVEWFAASQVMTSEQNCARWNRSFAGKPALASIACRGYPSGAILGQRALAHRVAWKWVTGRDPSEVDHINGIRSDNRWENLRDVDRPENAKNRRLSARNTSGSVGVYWCKRLESWRVRICVDGRRFHLGHFQTLEEAKAARKAADGKYGFHANNGAAMENQGASHG